MSEGSTTTKKRERTQNWVPEEKGVLLSLIKGHVGAIENKKVDAAASAMKTVAWQQIHRAFRNRFSTDRDVVRMREQWRRMKAQARIEVCSFVDKIKSVGAEEAVKSRPSGLSIEVWRLVENNRKIDSQADGFNDSNDRAQGNSTNLQEILDRLLESEPKAPVPEIKIEIDSDVSDADDEDVARGDLSPQRSHDSPKKRRISHDDKESVDGVEGRIQNFAKIAQRPNDASDNKNDTLPPNKHEKALNTEEESREKSSLLDDLATRRHELKLKMLQIELDRVELRRQTAMYELKAAETKRQMIEDEAMAYYSQIRMIGERGSGAGKGGGGGGTIREAGGSFGKMEAAHEDQYFYNQQKEQLQKIREGLHDEISFHEEQIKRHQEAINRHKKRITDMEKQ